MAPNFVGVFGHANLDFIFDVPRFPDPKAHASVQVKGERLLFGGTAGNLVRSAGELGLKVSIATFVGDDFPEGYIGVLKSAGVDLTDLKIIKGRWTPCCWIITDMNGDQVSIINEGAMAPPLTYPLPKHSIESSKIVHLMTGDPDYVLRIIEDAKKAGKQITFDPCQYTYMYSKEQMRKVLESVNYGFFNEYEANAVLRMVGKQKEEDFLEFLDWVAITRHERGSTIYSREGKPVQVGTAKPAKIVDPTGAGDAYRAGFYIGLSKGYDLETCGKIGATVASFIVEKVGCQTNIPTPELTKKRFEENFGGKLEF